MLWKNKIFICGICNKEFTRKNACKSLIPKFCSKDCYLEYHKKEIVICNICNKEFYPTLQNKKRKQQTCSKKCGYILRSQKPNGKTGKKYPHLQRAAIKKCRTCNNKFRAINDKYNRKQIYCSHNCYVKGNRVSAFEDSVFEYLLKHNRDIIRQIKIGGWSFDMQIQRTNILIEADGTYWHSIPNTIERDKRKNKWCTENGFELFRIDELQFYKSKQMACQVTIDRMLKLNPELSVKKT